MSDTGDSLWQHTVHYAASTNWRTTKSAYGPVACRVKSLSAGGVQVGASQGGEEASMLFHRGFFSNAARCPPGAGSAKLLTRHATSFDVSTDDLAGGESDREQRAVALFGVPDGPDLSVEIAARLLDRDERTATDALKDLCNLHLVESLAPRRYRLHDLLRMYARERAQARVSAADRAAAITRIVDLHASVAWRAVELCHPTASRLPWFRAHPIASGRAPGLPGLPVPLRPEYDDLAATLS